MCSHHQPTSTTTTIITAIGYVVSARGTYLQKSSLPEEPEVYTSTLPGGSRARFLDLKRARGVSHLLAGHSFQGLSPTTSALPEDGIPLRSQKDHGPRCKPLQELEVYAFRRAPRTERARAAYLYAPRMERARGAYSHGWKSSSPPHANPKQLTCWQ